MPGKELPEWLPEGWTATSKKRRDGRRADWTYIDSSTGSRLYSKAAVFRYLESEGLHTPSPNKERRIIVYSGADTSSSQRQSVDNKFNNNTEYSSSRLPDGWIKEFKLRKAGRKVKKEPYYVDPVSGYTFRSRKDALRYIAAGNVNACVIKPKKADNSNKFSIENVGSIVKQPDGQVTRKKSSSGAIKHKIVKQRDGQVTRKKSSSGAIKLKPTLRAGGPEDSPKWLPSGWITEIRTQQSGRCVGHTTKCFFDPVTKTRFHSKRTVLEYLGSVENHTPLAIKETSTETKSAGDICSPLTNKETSMETKSAGDIGSPLTNKVTSMETESAGDICSPLINKVTSMVMESAGDICTSSNQIGSANNKFTSNNSSSSYELPDGWIKEVRLRQSNCGVKKDPYYIDPVSGYEFRSRRDAWRYIESGDVRMCINRPRKRSRSDIYSMEMEDPPPNLVHMRKETEIQPSHGEGIFLESAREKTLHETEVNTSPGKKLVVIRKSNNSSSRGRRKRRPRKQLSEKKQADSQRQGSAAQLRPKKTKPFKAIAPPTRSSQRLAAALKNKQVVDSGIGNPPEGPTSMAIVDIDFLRKLEVEGPPPVVEETKASGDRPDDIQNQESAAQLCPGETKSFEGITRPDRSLEQLPMTEADHVVDAGISDTPSQTMPIMPEILSVTPEQGTVQSSEKADEQKAAPTVNQDEQEGTLQSSDKAAEEQMTLPQGTGPVTPVQDAFDSSKKAAAAAVPAVDQYFSVKLEVQSAAQSSEKADEQKAAPTVNQDEQEGTLQSSGKAAEEQMTLPQGTGPVTPAQDAFESSEKAAAAAVPAAGQYFSVKLEVQEQPQTVETKPSFDTPDSPLGYPFGDSWPDPCLEFAFRTLTGDIPMLDDTASIENYFQQQVIQSPSLVPKPRVHHPTQQGSSGAQANGLQSGHGV